ncbi:unnamed protein product [Haemonchus placei]|uniref:Pept_C1 domain-containing protein n=1 Tax=Haemonchus placei TaxID=6290 RepID=A0A158QNG4_HAEPC|nr:unnamed protein product [Haemonchus placei]
MVDAWNFFIHTSAERSPEVRTTTTNEDHGAGDYVRNSKIRCEGGWPIEAFKFFAYQGAVTGGDYGDKVHISSIDFVSCCDSCGFGCEGGWPIDAFEYYSYQGAVTGGDYGSKNGCRPYPFHPCGHHGNETYYGECPKEESTPTCVKQCQKSYKKSYRRDKTWGFFRMVRGTNHCGIEEDVVAGHVRG